MELEILQKIAHNTEPKESFQIIVNDNKTKFTTQFHPHYPVQEKLESALCGDANPRRLQRQSCCG